MAELSDTVLEQIGRDAARVAFGKDLVTSLTVRPGLDWTGRPQHEFTYVVADSDRERVSGLVRVRLTQHLQDALQAAGDETYPFTRILKQAEWDERQPATAR